MLEGEAGRRVEERYVASIQGRLERYEVGQRRSRIGSILLATFLLLE